MQEKLFKSLIKCSLCGSNFVGIIENTNMKYVCGGYKKNKCQKRIIVKEELILFVIERNAIKSKAQIIKTNDYMKSIINFIQIDENGYFIIHYKDGYTDIYKQDIMATKVTIEN